MECRFNPRQKHHYDISMSKRTRKALNLEENKMVRDKDSGIGENDLLNLFLEGDRKNDAPVMNEEEENQDSLKGLINGSRKEEGSSTERSKSRNSLEENQNSLKGLINGDKKEERSSGEGSKNLLEENQNSLKGLINGDKKEERSSGDGSENRNSLEENHNSLKKLISGDKKEQGSSDEGSENRNSLGQCFTEEQKQLQLVNIEPQRSEGVKLKGMVRRYAKVMTKLIKIKHDPSRGTPRKPVLLLTK